MPIDPRTIGRARLVAATLLAVVAGIGSGACRQDMHDQPKYIPLREAPFFSDNRSARAPVPGTVARGQLRDDALLYTGKVNGVDTTEFPFPVTEPVMARGQERFNIYCSPCHGRTGLGDGMVVRRGYRHPPSLHDDRLRNAPVGHFFDVMTNGFGAMPDYAAQVKVSDRWAIAAYIRALQLSGHATVADVPASERGKTPVTPFKDTADVAIPELAGHQRRLLVAGGVLGLISLVGLFTNPTQFLQSYLMAYMFCLALTLGCFALGMLHQLSGGAWGVVIRRPIGAASRVLPVMTALFLPIVFGMSRLYPWTDAALVARDEVLRHKQAYLNVPFWIIRAGIYFFAWNAIGYFLNKWSLDQDRTGDPRIARRMQRLSAGGLVVYGLTITFASFDWLMSLEPHWYSTIFGALILAGQALSGLAFLLIALAWLSRRPPLDGIVAPGHFHDIGNLLLAFTMLWAYFSFSQYLIIWAGNLPAEIAWYQHRTDSSWRIIGMALILFHFAVPFVLLLSRTIKRQAALILKLAIAVLAARLLDLYWLIAPEFHPQIWVSWLDILLPVAMTLLWLGFFVRQLRGRAILPVHDPQFDEALGSIIRRGGGRAPAAH